MRRIIWFLRALPLGAKLQQAVFALILAYNFIAIDLNPINRLFGSPLWMTTVPIIIAMIVLSRLMLPLMMAHPHRSQQFLQGFGLVIFGVWLFGRSQWWGALVITYLGLVAGLWLEAAASFWFVSEIQRRQELVMSSLSELMASADSTELNDSENEDDDEQHKDPLDRDQR